jgi:hypothetical protein
VSDHLEGKDWRELSEAASREQDPHKLLELVRALNKALEERENQIRERNREQRTSNALQMFQTYKDELSA